MVLVYCGCSKFMLEIFDHKTEVTYRAGECLECSNNNGEYFKGSHWRESCPSLNTPHVVGSVESKPRTPSKPTSKTQKRNRQR